MMLRVGTDPGGRDRMLRNTNRRVELEKRITLADVVQIREFIVESSTSTGDPGIHRPSRLGDAGPGRFGRPALRRC